jgi:hypothetical protein
MFPLRAVSTLVGSTDDPYVQHTAAFNALVNYRDMRFQTIQTYGL